MMKTIEELYRETKEKATKKKDSGVRYEKPKPPERWYEKHWGIWLLLIICFPLGIILLCSSRKYSSGSKIVIALAMVWVIFFVHNSYQTSEKPSSSRQEASYTTQRSSYDVGYLKQGAEWTDGDTVYKNKKRVQVEIWDRKIVMADGSRLRQIFFLEGSHAGKWGYTQDRSLSR